VILMLPFAHARIEGTRVAVHDVIGLLQNGESVKSITTMPADALEGAGVRVPGVLRGPSRRS